MRDARALRQFGLTVGGAFLLLAVVALWRGRPAVATIPGAAGALLVAAGLLAPASLRGVRRRWMAGAHAISRVTTPLFMGLVYFGVMTPLGLALRAVRRRGLSPRRDADTFLVRRAPGERRSDLRRQF
jgi:hypothetical protein